MLEFFLASDHKLKTQMRVFQFDVVIRRDGLALADLVESLGRVYGRFVRLLWPEKSENDFYAQCIAISGVCDGSLSIVSKYLQRRCGK